MADETRPATGSESEFDPITSKSLSFPYLIAALLLIGGYRVLDPEVQMTTGDLIQFFFLANIFFNPDLALEIRQGNSWAKGIEFSGQKKEGKLTGFVSYTLSKVILEKMR